MRVPSVSVAVTCRSVDVSSTVSSTVSCAGWSERFEADARGPSDGRSLEARDALGVVVDRELLKLLAVVVAGWWMLETGGAETASSPGLPHLLSEGIGALTTLVGVALLVVGALALLVKLFYEATKLAKLR